MRMRGAYNRNGVFNLVIRCNGVCNSLLSHSARPRLSRAMITIYVSCNNLALYASAACIILNVRWKTIATRRSTVNALILWPTPCDIIFSRNFCRYAHIAHRHAVSCLRAALWRHVNICNRCQRVTHSAATSRLPYLAYHVRSIYRR